MFCSSFRCDRADLKASKDLFETENDFYLHLVFINICFTILAKVVKKNPSLRKMRTLVMQYLYTFKTPVAFV